MSVMLVLPLILESRDTSCPVIKGYFMVWETEDALLVNFNRWTYEPVYDSFAVSLRLVPKEEQSNPPHLVLSIKKKRRQQIFGLNHPVRWFLQAKVRNLTPSPLCLACLTECSLNFLLAPYVLLFSVNETIEKNILIGRKRLAEKYIVILALMMGSYLEWLVREGKKNTFKNKLIT